jgi:hypothetical protein
MPLMSVNMQSDPEQERIVKAITMLLSDQSVEKSVEICLTYLFRTATTLPPEARQFLSHAVRDFAGLLAEITDTLKS